MCQGVVLFVCLLAWSSRAFRPCSVSRLADLPLYRFDITLVISVSCFRDAVLAKAALRISCFTHCFSDSVFRLAGTIQILSNMLNQYIPC